MSDDGRRSRCRNCGKEFAAGELDADGWCTACRQEVIRRSTIVARIVGGATALLVTAAIAVYVLPLERFLVAFLVLIAAVFFLVYKFARRIAFEVIRGRGVTPREEA
ncbi:MAG TPA: hypothetical protein VFI91_00435 [Longimicrobiaceae bacterium]|nr:hypothetical protein [Longimicrobiaceae bacterium]